MPRITEEQALEKLDFKCAKCSAECTKINIAEPELGYISKTDGEFFGPLCKDCAKEIPDNELVLRKLPETAFLVLIKPDGEGAFITTEGIDSPYLREPTSYDIISACNKISSDVAESINSQKLIASIARASAMAQKQPKLVIPR